ncbi:SRPBCC domain-containing protein [Sinomonas sp. P47F7]|uniref:SRPBCC domain-containing protein n=1 Tax=Sinomonas sp. P47F7 TaxID=3410987 RepID=UPI003BF50B78
MDGEFSHTYSAFIRANPDQVWKALTDPAQTVQYFPYSAARSDWQAGSACTYAAADGSIGAEGTVVQANPPHRLVQTIHVNAFRGYSGHPEFTLTWDIEQFGEATKLTVTHTGPDTISEFLLIATSHCPHTVSGVKTLLETGTPLRISDPALAR